jgi:NAD(P)H-nitrite reductase large subunit
MQHVVIGAGPAGVVAAEHLRKYDRECKITLIGEEPEPPYSRMAIPYLLINKIDEQGTYLRKHPGHYDKLGIEVLRDRVSKVDAKASRLELAGGASMSYDRLLVASGASPLSPPIPGVELDGVHPCWTLAHARKILKRTGKGNAIVLIGAGFIGSIILEALAASGADLTVVEVENRMVPKMMNDTAGGMIKHWCENRGVTVYTSTRVQGIEQAKGGRPLKVVLDNGQALDADMVITATGVRSNTAFLEGSGLEVEQGLLVDQYLQASVAGVYAAGDVAQGTDFSTGGRVVQAIQPTAVEHGRIAALNMVRGNSIRHRGTVNMNVLDTLGLISSSFAMWMGVDGGDSAELYDPERFRYLNLQFQDDVLVGATSLGLTDHVGVIRGLIQTRTRLGDWKNKLAQDPSRLMEAYLSRTQAVGHNAYVI